ncbi:MAG: hypothetical protein MZW92_46090 [Comamonadaceae bacterium]|nr:hypothetical protein [Comamonadaceae bacterium]
MAVAGPETTGNGATLRGVRLHAVVSGSVNMAHSYVLSIMGVYSLNRLIWLAVLFVYFLLAFLFAAFAL